MSLITQLKFDENGLIPAITQDVATGEVLMMAYMNAQAVEQTLVTGKVHYYSRSRQKPRLKGESSGHFQLVQEIRFDCDNDCLLIRIEQRGDACHTGQRSCFYRQWDGEVKAGSAKRGEVTALDARQDILATLYNIIQERKQLADGEKSYVKSLFDKGLDKILGKIGEEATETAVAGKGGIKEEIIGEVADLFFHVLVLLGFYDLPPERIYAELRRRFGLSGHEEKANRSK